MADDTTDFDRNLGSIKNLFITKLAEHPREKKTLRGPFHRLQGDLAFSSWKDNALPLYGWAALTAGLLSREKYLPIFREIALRVKTRHDDFKDELYLNHIALKESSNTQFDFVFQPLLKLQELRPYFASLAKLHSLPDREHWKRYGADDDKSDADFTALASGYTQCFDHQSQQATDIRWLILMNFLANDRIVLGQPMEERFLEIVEYPNRGDMRSVRPSIRAIEISLRGDPNEKNHKEKDKKYNQTAEEIWAELFAGTPCMPLPFLEPVAFDYRDVTKEAFDLYKSVAGHFLSTIETTDVDARHDSSFGLVLYSLTLLLEGCSLRAHQRVASRLILRTILEAHINLRFLKEKDDDTIWFQYRNYGSGQAKLAFLKFLDAKQKPDYVDLQELFRFTNEDMWLEYQDINLGSWAKKPLRDIAVEAGLKETYDQHYSILSSSIHAQWTGIRENTFVLCASPLHRFHRIADMPRFSQDNLISDRCKLINQMLDDLNHLYPTFKDRLRKYRAIPQGLQVRFQAEVELTEAEPAKDGAAKNENS
jgi:hypothetical protein